jgi:hypothetical protein
MNLAFAFSREENSRRELTMNEPKGASATPKEPILFKSERILLREFLWILGSIGAALFIGANNEYGYSVVPFFSVSFYLLAGIFRLLGALVRWLARRVEP